MVSRVGGSVAFALGGLGGLNTHGIGFLEAARALGVTPDFITCTSGMIPWVADWLSDRPLQPRLEELIRQGNRFPPPFHWFNTLWLATFGDPATVRPAVWEYWRRWLKPLDRPDAGGLFDRLWPAQLYVPRRSEEDFRRMAGIFNASATPVAFNSYHLSSGTGRLHINPAAQRILGIPQLDAASDQKYHAITPETIRGALWLYFYGFDEEDNPVGLIDGSYDRQFIISELHHCDRIYIARPRNTRWRERPPQNYFEIQDFTTEQCFNRAIAAETAGMHQINRLLRDGTLLDHKFHPIDLIEVDVARPYGFFESVIDEREIFDTAFRRAYQILTQRECEV